jgi:23S rRNA (cytidine1920-2'-O)/16S rRNA (cytidine1409-2'-O)-methyltransferase
MKKNQRLDNLVVNRGLANSQDLAQRLVMAGEVRVDDQVVLQPATLVPAEAEITLVRSPRFVSRGGEKLEGALQAFPIRVSGQVCADTGASTGGFTDCLLQHEAARVYAIDVGKGILDWKLRQEPRVVVMEETNARGLERLPEPVTLVTIDVSFISLKVLLPVVRGWLEDTAANDIIALIKPQFEAGREQAGRGKGVIRDPAVHQQVLLEIQDFAKEEGFGVMGLIPSPLLGAKGNQEFLIWLSYPARSQTQFDLVQNEDGLSTRIAYKQG